MYPTICTIGPITIYSYGVMMALAFFICSWLLSRDACRFNLSSEVVSDMIFWIVISGLLGARLFFIVLNWDYFRENPVEIFMIQHGGLSWQGGFILGSGAGLYLVRKRSLPLLPVVDLFAPYIALGQAIGRIGCFLNGCCYGKEVAWGMFFPVHQARLHPTQIYESLGLLGVFFILKKCQQLKHGAGDIFFLYLFLASMLRFIVEFFRGDPAPVLGGLRIFQVISLGITLLAVYVRVRRKSR